jgi:hypothetical protein
MEIKLTYTQIRRTIDTFGSQFNKNIKDQIKQLRKRQNEIDNLVNTNDELKFPFNNYNDLITEWDAAETSLHKIVITCCTTNQLQQIKAGATYA